MSLKQEVNNFLDHMRPFDGVLDSPNRAKYMNGRNTTNKNIGLSNSNGINDRNKINHNSKGLKNVNHFKVRPESNNTVTNNLSSQDNNVKALLSDNSHRSDIQHTSKRHHRSDMHHRSERHHRSE